MPFVLSNSPLSAPYPPPRIHFTKRPTSFYHCGFENRQGEKCLKVLGIQLFQSMNLGQSLKSVLPFIVPCGKICTAKVRRVRQPMTRRLQSARHRLTSERTRDPGLSLRGAGERREWDGSGVTWCTEGSVKNAGTVAKRYRSEKPEWNCRLLLNRPGGGRDVGRAAAFCVFIGPFMNLLYKK